MCGIAGALVLDARRADLTRLLDVIGRCVVRGRDSFGLVRWTREAGWAAVRTTGSAPPEASRLLEDSLDEGPMFVLHTSRAEPTTEWCREKCERDVPPFVQGEVGVAHNGIICNDGEIAARFALNPPSAIDTAILPELVARVGVWRAVAELRGGSALAILDTRRECLCLCRNFLPLVICWQPGMIAFASEAALFAGSQDPFQEFGIWPLPPYCGIEIAPRGWRYPVVWGEVPDWERGEGWRPYPAWIL